MSPKEEHQTHKIKHENNTPCFILRVFTSSARQACSANAPKRTLQQFHIFNHTSNTINNLHEYERNNFKSDC